MGWYGHNVYYSPEEFDLEQVAILEDPPCYDFDMMVVWRHKDGTIYYGSDSGCSCPEPFEDVSDLADLQTGDVYGYAQGWVADEYRRLDPADVTEFLAKVAAL